MTGDWSERARLVFLTAILLVVGGCASVSTRPASIPHDLADLDHWQARGRIGVSGPESGGSGSFDWVQRGDRAQIQIRGPVGVGSVRLELRGEGSRPDLRLQTGNGETLESEAAWMELEARLGAEVPAGQLRYWLLGLAAPGEHQWIDASEDAATLEQDGWRIHYQRYSTDPGVRVPVRLRAMSGDARVRIVVDRWQLGQ